jgi:vacuolar-type H+-ATPase subunit H
MDQSNTLEEFIDRLQNEGVEAGLREAEEVRSAAAREAAALIKEARETGRQVVEQAEVEAREMLAEARRELALVVRDVHLGLRTSLERVLTSLLEQGLEERLEDPELLARLLAEVVSAYARGDAEGRTLEIEVRPELVEELTAAVPGILGRALADGSRMNVKAGLEAAGFEYRIEDGVVEITPASVADALVRYVSPHLRTLLRAASGEEGMVVTA